MFRVIAFFLFIVASAGHLLAREAVYLQENIKTAQAGDFIVVVQNKMYTLLHIYNRSDDALIIEEITVPIARMSKQKMGWREWVFKAAPGSTSWIMYLLDLKSLSPGKYFSVLKNSWFEMPDRENFLATLLSLRMELLTDHERKKIGTAIIPNSDSRQLWNPPLIIDGQVVAGVYFDAWKTKWPQDGSEIAGKTIEVYTPQDKRYARYFPYWLQISGVVGSAKVRIVDSGHGLLSPAPAVFELIPGSGGA